jgi:16S rRNA U516 pseudouridylate synthase RsuA-like enzyme
LRRIKIGPLKVSQNLKVGKYRSLNKVEVESLYSLAVPVNTFKKRKMEKV